MAATVSNRFVVALGPIKMEILNLTTVTDADTVSTLIQRPLFAIGVSNSDETATNNTNISISGKTLTINNADFGGADECNILVFGF